jgi:hypothetical protein
MERRRFTVLAATTFAAAASLDRAQADEKIMPDAMAPVAISIAVPKHHAHRSLNTASHFHALVTNTSDKPVRLWTDRFSWGYDNLSFDLIGDGGEVVRITKNPRDWTKNYPDWLELAPGETYVLNVDFFSDAGKEIWDNPPVAEGAAKPKLLKLRAVYEISPDTQSKELGVWTGKITSAAETYAVW